MKFVLFGKNSLLRFNLPTDRFNNFHLSQKLENTMVYPAAFAISLSASSSGPSYIYV